jgi:mono/diheme cytochrome c family protein
MWKRAIQFSYVVLFSVAGAVVLSGSQSARNDSARVERGRYLVTSIGCSDCHTPKNFGPNGPELDTKRLLSGHPAEMVMPPAPTLPPGPWVVSGAGSLTAWAGPWGTSFAANLTPDDETGIGLWKEEEFVGAIRTGRHMGRGRPILPPMPAENYANLTDEDLRSVFAYLKSIPAVKNRVPEPIAPVDAH